MGAGSEDDLEEAELREWLECVQSRDETSAIRKLMDLAPRIGEGPTLLAAKAVSDALPLREQRRMRELDLPEKPRYETVRRAPRLTLSPPTASPRELRAFADLAEACYWRAAELFDTEVEDLHVLAQIARNCAKSHKGEARERDMVRQQGGRKLSLETPLADLLDRILEPLPAGERHSLIGDLLSEWFGTVNTSAEQIRSRLRDYRRHLQTRIHNPADLPSEDARQRP